MVDVTAYRHRVTLEALPTKIFTQRSSSWLKIGNNRQVIRNSMQEHKARARCRRNGEESLGSTQASWWPPRIRISHIYNPKMYLWQGARGDFLGKATGEDGTQQRQRPPPEVAVTQYLEFSQVPRTHRPVKTRR